MSETTSDSSFSRLPIAHGSKDRSRGIGCSMSAEAISERLRIMSDLSRWCQELGQAKRIGKAEDIQPSNQKQM